MTYEFINYLNFEFQILLSKSLYNVTSYFQNLYSNDNNYATIKLSTLYIF